jgi:hypothetical protein
MIDGARPKALSRRMLLRLCLWKGLLVLTRSVKVEQERLNQKVSRTNLRQPRLKAVRVTSYIISRVGHLY